MKTTKSMERIDTLVTEITMDLVGQKDPRRVKGRDWRNGMVDFPDTGIFLSNVKHWTEGNISVTDLDNGFDINDVDDELQSIIYTADFGFEEDAEEIYDKWVDLVGLVERESGYSYS